MSLTTTPGVFESNKIFVGGLSNECTSKLLKESFTQYGSVNDVSVFGADDNTGKRKPYAFVTFDSPQSAADAISWANNENLYKQVERTNPIDACKSKRTSKARQKEENHRLEIMQTCDKTNLILLVQSTHLDRLKEYIQFKKSEFHDMVFQVEGSTSEVTRNMSLLFLSVCNPAEMARRLSQNPILSRALRKAYVVAKGAMEADLRDSADCEKVVKDLLQRTSTDQGASFRLHAFPPSRQSQILSAIETIEESSDQSVVLDPRHFTDILSIVQVYSYKGRRIDERKDERKDEFPLAMSGVSPSFATGGTDNFPDAVSRAYYKLKEAMGKYPIDSSIFNGSIALDCGSAPGGWTKFLADDMQCSLVYSVDPGELLIDIDNVRHMKMKIQDAMPLLKHKQSKIKIWVSDMCLHEMQAQVDFLLLAKEEGILEENSFFVLTLKCNTGHSKTFFDSQAEEILENLTSRAETGEVAMYHLFSNRSGERTIMGFLL